ncbi:MAG: hypothetical protein IPP41_09660 [Rhodocyclaceae bacterium]|nr:hypothetical protein [Rhodocyclaceae bacterium]
MAQLSQGFGSHFNQRPVLRMGVWCWEEDKDFELDYHLRRLALPRPGASASCSLS